MFSEEDYKCPYCKSDCPKPDPYNYYGFICGNCGESYETPDV